MSEFITRREAMDERPQIRALCGIRHDNDGYNKTSVNKKKAATDGARFHLVEIHPGNHRLRS